MKDDLPPLTDAQIDRIWDQWFSVFGFTKPSSAHTRRGFARAIESEVHSQMRAYASQAVAAAVAADRARWASVMAEALEQAEVWIDESRGCKPSDLMGYTGWAERARGLIGSAPNAPGEARPTTEG